MGTLYLLDTDTASYALKGRHPELEARLRRTPPSALAISAVTRAELQYGLKSLPSDHRLHAPVQHFLRIVRVLAWDAEAADLYAEVRYRLTRTGRPIGELDMMIAAHALALRAVLVTNNTRHFARIGLQLETENWVSDRAV